jgi:hypothetical protein
VETDASSLAKNRVYAGRCDPSGICAVTEDRMACHALPRIERDRERRYRKSSPVSKPETSSALFLTTRRSNDRAYRRPYELAV